MAKQTGLFKFTGKLDNVIGYRRNGVHFVRSMPDKVRQTPATRRAAREFGVASRKGRLIRRAISPYLGRHDSTSVNRLNKVLIQLRNNRLQGIEGFRFNRHTGLDKIFAQLPVYTAAGVVKIPAQELPLLGRASHLEVNVIAARINFAERRIVDVESVTELIDLSREFTGMELAASVGGKGTLIVTVQVQACSQCNGKILPVRDRRYMAADIVSVVPPVMCDLVVKRSGKKHFPMGVKSRKGWVRGTRKRFPVMEQDLPIIEGGSGGFAREGQKRSYTMGERDRDKPAFLRHCEGQRSRGV